MFAVICSQYVQRSYAAQIFSVTEVRVHIMFVQTGNCLKDNFGTASFLANNTAFPCFSTQSVTLQWFSDAFLIPPANIIETS